MMSVYSKSILHSWFRYFIRVYGISDSSNNSTINVRHGLGYTVEPNRNRYHGRRIRSFFIETILERTRNKKKALLEHYKTLKEDVLDRWIQQEAELHLKIDEFPDSFVLLYVKISENLKSTYFNRLRAHLKTSYKETDNIVTDIEQNEPKHNQRVADFINRLKPRIRNAIYVKDDCNIENMTEHVLGSDWDPVYYRKQSRLYFRTLKAKG